MSNKYTPEPDEEDSKTILIAIFIKKYLKGKRVNSRLCMQLLRSEGKTHYILSLNKQVKNDQVVCIEELKLSLFAKSCLCPGLIAMMTN